MSTNGMMGTKAGYAKMDRSDYSFEEMEEKVKEMTANNVEVLLSTVEHYWEISKTLLDKVGEGQEPEDLWREYRKEQYYKPEEYPTCDEYAEALSKNENKAKAMVALSRGIYALMQPFAAAMATSIYGDNRPMNFSELHMHSVFSYMMRHVEADRFFMVDEAFGGVMNVIANEEKISSNNQLSLLFSREASHKFEEMRRRGDTDLDPAEVIDYLKSKVSKEPAGVLISMLEEAGLSVGALLKIQNSEEPAYKVEQFNDLQEMSDKLKEDE
jgi:hypothetical protein